MSATDLLRKLKRDTDTAIKSLQAFNETLAELMPRVEEVEALETRAAAAKRLFDDATQRYTSTEAELEQTKAEYARLLAEVSVPATKLTEIRTMLRDIKTN
jgi:hypothetical protein